MIEQLSKHVHAVFNEEGFTASNCIFVDDDRRLVIDSGAGGVLDQIQPETVDTLLNSHHHLDHIRGNDLFINAKIFAHPVERAAMQSVEKVTATSGWNDLMDEDIMTHARTFGGLPERILQPWKVDEDLHDGKIIRCGSTKIMVIHTPGHTAGHCSFFFPDEGILFSGDICLTVAGPWYGEEHADIDDFISSINKIIDINPRILVTGHRTNTIDSNIIGTLTEYRERILKREKRILNFIKKKPGTINEIAQQMLIYRAHPTVFVLFWEKSMVKKHLERLMRLGAVEMGETGKYLCT